MCCLTETWQRPQEFMLLNQATPPGYVYLQKPCPVPVVRLKRTARSKRSDSPKSSGGGLAVIYREDLPVKELPVPVTTSFECIAFTLAVPAPLQVVLIYRFHHTAHPVFLTELSDLLYSACFTSPSTLLIGDFNIDVDVSSNKFATDFLLLLDSFNITQHVQVPNHKAGHTLDVF